MSGFRYRVRVFDPTDVVTPRVTLDEGTPALTGVNELDVTPAGDCGDASFTIVPTETDVRARDVVSIETTRAGGTAGALDWEGLYRGFVVQAPNSRETRPATVRLAGLRQRLFETTVTRHLVDGADVWGMADDLLAEMESAGTLPAGVTYAAPSPAPLLGFELGTRYPALESVGDLLDALVETVGEFVVPAGSTHEYRGITYLPGDTVPACAWGVDSAGELFMERPQAPAVSASERSVTTEVQWSDVDAESVVNSVRLVYATETATGDLKEYRTTFPDGTAQRLTSLDNVNFIPLSLAFPLHAPADVSEVVYVPKDPIALMARAALDIVTEDNVTDASNALDGNASTYAELAGAVNNLLTLRSSTASAGVWRVRIETGVDTAVQLNIMLFYTVGGQFRHSTHSYDLPSESLLDAYFPNLEPVTRQDTLYEARIHVFRDGMIGGEAARVYLLDFFVPDVDVGGGASRAYAGGLMREARESAAVVTVAGLHRFSRYLNLTPVTGSDILMPIERIAYSLTSEDGVKTAYHAGQAYDARLEAERTLLERLARRAVGAGGRRR